MTENLDHGKKMTMTQCPGIMQASLGREGEQYQYSPCNLCETECSHVLPSGQSGQVLCLLGISATQLDALDTH